MAEGLRERKKRQTRQLISDVATGLFLERGFDAVTMADIAEAAEVSVNTVYNYFQSKEDLFFDRRDTVVQRLSRFVRGREAGESAADAVLGGLRAEVEAVSPTVGLFEGYDRFMRTVHGAHTLKSRLWYIQQEAVDRLEETLREETGAADDDPVPGLMAGQLAWVQSALMAYVGREMVAGRPPAEVSRDALVILDEIEELLGDKVIAYATKTTP